MKRFLKRTLLIALLSGTAAQFSSAQSTPDSTREDKGTEEVRRLNVDEVQSFLQKDPKAMARLWSDDFVVTNRLNKFVNKQQVLGMVESGFLIITSYDRQVEYVRSYDDTVIVAGSETVVGAEKCRMRERQNISDSRRSG